MFCKEFNAKILTKLMQLLQKPTMQNKILTGYFKTFYILKSKNHIECERSVNFCNFFKFM